MGGLVFDKNDCSDANLATSNGIYRTFPTTLNIPISDYGILEVNRSANYIVQEYTTMNNGQRKYYRVKPGTDTEFVDWINLK